MVKEREVLPVKRLPRVCTIEEPNSYIAYDFRFEVPDIHAHPRVLLGVKGFPVGCAATSAAAHSAQGFVALNVRIGAFRVSMNHDGANVVVGPERAQSSTNRAIAIGDLRWTVWNLNSNGTAVTCGFEHVSVPAVNG